jgi:hypoxanthine phosphoribosyltransferase
MTQPNQLYQQSTEIVSASAVTLAIEKMAAKIDADFKQHQPQSEVVLLCVMTGGLYLAGQLLAVLKTPLQLSYVHVQRYNQTLQGDVLNWFVEPMLSLQNKTVLVVDDILDEGITLAAVKQKCLTLGAKQVFVAVLTDKDNQLQKPIQADYVGLLVPNQYIFGCGMDVQGWWRNLPSIRALNTI